jgi:hypothetical protein
MMNFGDVGTDGMGEIKEHKKEDYSNELLFFT